MTECRRVEQYLAPYADGELPMAERGTVAAHLETCPACRALVATEAGARQALRGAGPVLREVALPPGLRSRCEALASTAGTRGAGTAWGLRFVTAAFALFVLVTASVLATRRSDTVLAAQLTADHVKCFGLFADENGAGMESSEVERLLAARYGWEVHVPPSSEAEGTALIGGRRCLYLDGPVPHVMYRAGGQDVSLFILAGEARPPADLDVLGHHTRIWSKDGTTFVMVTSSSAPAVARTVGYVQREAR